MREMDEIVACVQRTLNTSPAGTAVVVWPEGIVSTRPPGHALDPDELDPDIPDPVAKFIAGSSGFPEQEIEDEINAGLARNGRWTPAQAAAARAHH